MSDNNVPSQPIQFSRKRKPRIDDNEEFIIKNEPLDTDIVVAVPSALPTLEEPKRPVNVRLTAMEKLDQAIANQRLATPVSTPLRNATTVAGVQQQQQPLLSAAERATQRASIDEKKLYSDYYSQVIKWIALARIAQNFIATAVTAETAVDLARAEETDATKFK